MTGQKRVVFLINSLEGGGAERVMCTLLHHSAAERNEFDIKLAILDDEPAANTPPDWIDVRQFDCRKSLWRSILAIRKLYHETKPDVAVSFLTRANIANVVNARMPSVISERANTSAHLGGGGLRAAISRALVHAVYPRATRIIAVSDGVAADLRDNFGVRPERIVSISNPVDIDTIQAKAAATPEIAVAGPYILAAGRLVKSKNFDMLIRAYAASGSQRTLVIAGEGPERAALIETARASGVVDRVMLPGFVRNPYALMRGADMFVLSSDAEGFPNALVEAMSLGTPVIATNCPSGPSEILAEAARETVTGLTFAAHGVITPPNAQDCMTEALRAMEDADRRKRYGEKAAARARAFSPSVAKDRYWEVIRAALREG